MLQHHSGAGFRDALDIVFENRNKAYGAYQLRRDEDKYLIRALLIGLMVIGAAVLISRLLSSLELGAPEDAKVSIISFSSAPKIDEPLPNKAKIEPPKPAGPSAPKNTVRFLPPVLSPDAKDNKEAAPPLVDDKNIISCGANPGGDGDDIYRFDADAILGTDTIREDVGSGGVDTLDFSEQRPRFDGEFWREERTVARRILGERAGLDIVLNAYAATQGADALLIVTEWREFRTPDWDQLQALMKSPVLFDGRNLFAPAMVKAQGFEYHAIGRRTGSRSEGSQAMV